MSYFFVFSGIFLRLNPNESSSENYVSVKTVELLSNTKQSKYEAASISFLRVFFLYETREWNDSSRTDYQTLSNISRHNYCKHENYKIWNSVRSKKAFQLQNKIFCYFINSANVLKTTQSTDQNLSDEICENREIY